MTFELFFHSDSRFKSAMNFLYLHILINHGKVQIAYHISVHICDEGNHEMEIELIKKLQHEFITLARGFH